MARITQQEIDARRGVKPGASADAAAKKAYHGYVVGMRRLKADQEAEKRQTGYDASVEQARTEGKQYADQVRGAVSGLSLGNVGLDEESLAKRAGERAQMFQGQQGTLVNRQGAQQRDMSEALQRRLQSSGLRGTGAAERLARVQESGMAEQSGMQQAELAMGQGQQELAAKDAERSAVISAQNFIDQMKLSAESTATQLEQAGVESAKAKNFSAEEAAKARAFQETVLLPMQNDQFKEQLATQVKQFNEQMKLNIKNYNLEKDAQEFNKWLAIQESNKKSIFDRILPQSGGATALGVAGGVAGGMVGGPWGAAAGAAAGSALGNELGI